MTKETSKDLELEARMALADKFLDSGQLDSYASQRLWNDKEDITASLTQGIEMLKDNNLSADVVGSILSKEVASI